MLFAGCSVVAVHCLFVLLWVPLFMSIEEVPGLCRFLRVPHSGMHVPPL